MLRRFLVVLCLLTCLGGADGRLPVVGDWVDVWVSVGNTPKMITGDIIEIDKPMGLIALNGTVMSSSGVCDLRNKTNISIGVGSIIWLRVVGD